DASRPRKQSGNPQTALEQFGLSPGEGPGIGKALAAIVASEDDDRVFGQPIGIQSLKNAADLTVHLADHFSVSFLRTAVEIHETGAARLTQAFGLCFVAWSFPEPVRSAEMQAEKKRLSRLCVGVHDVHGATAKQTCKVAGLVDRDI